MENWQQEPWTREEWDAYVQHVLAQGDPEGDGDPVHLLNQYIKITQEE